ncbi:MAG: CD225/dispanin family protein [Thermoleophilia bacterium]|nr:CD225/dispanin family protein [Thermoleophilia bacterium]
MYCPQCGAENDDTSRYCTVCGQNLQKYKDQWSSPGGNWSATPGQYGPGPVPPPYVPSPPPVYAGTLSRHGIIPHIPSYMGWAIAVLILCFWPTGIAAVVYASRVGEKLAIGDIAGAQEASRKAKMWCWISFAIAVAFWVIGLVAAFFLAWPLAIIGPVA